MTSLQGSLADLPSFVSGAGAASRALAVARREHEARPMPRMSLPIEELEISTGAQRQTGTHLAVRLLAADLLSRA